MHIFLALELSLYHRYETPQRDLRGNLMCTSLEMQLHMSLQASMHFWLLFNCSCFLHLYNFHLNMINNQVFFPLQQVFCRYSWLQLKCMKRRFPQNNFFSPQSIVCTPMDKAKECQRMSETRLSTCTRLQWAARPIKKQLGEINQKWKKNKSSYSLRNSMQALASWIEDDDEKRWWISPKIQRSLSTI